MTRQDTIDTAVKHINARGGLAREEVRKTPYDTFNLFASQDKKNIIVYRFIAENCRFHNVTWLDIL